MTDRPIIFSAPMVRALLDGRKTQTRRVLRVQPGDAARGCYRRPDGRWIWVSAPRPDNGVGYDGVGVTDPFRIPYAPGDRLYAREAFKIGNDLAPDLDLPPMWIYRATSGDSSGPWRSPIHMPRRASRLTLTVTDVRVQRLQEISGKDAKAEGAAPWTGAEQSYRTDFAHIWRSLHGPDAWDANPWVAAISFAVQNGNIDQIGGAA